MQKNTSITKEMHPPSIPVVLGQVPQEFPDPQLSLTMPNGLLAIGGMLSSKQLLLAYSSGIFPWFNEGDPLLWWSPNPRCLLFPNQFKMSRSLKKSLRKDVFITVDLHFEQVIRACCYLRKKKEGTWITNQMLEAYIKLFNEGFAHSIEVWHENKLVGGLYGLSLGHAFFGESMFHISPNASKIALYALCNLPLPFTFDFIDCQLPTNHLSSLGSVECSRKTFLEMLKNSLKKQTYSQQWSLPVISGRTLLGEKG